MSNIPSNYTFDFLPETFKIIQERVKEQNAKDKNNGYVPEDEFNSQGESIYTDGAAAFYSKSFANPETGETAILSSTYCDTDLNGTYDQYSYSTFYGTADMYEKLLEEGQIFYEKDMLLRDTDDNGEFDTLLARKNSVEMLTYTRESEESNTFTRGFAEKFKDFCHSIGDFFQSLF